MSKSDARMEEFREFLKERRLSAAGMSGRPWGATSRETEPVNYAAGHVKWADLHAALIQAGELVTLGPGSMVEMRVVNGSGGLRAPISLNAQILMPGERTRSHRNMKNETRLVWSAPADAVFVCDGESFLMGRGDVIISPTWTFHDSFNPATNTEPAIWIDGFDRGYSSLGEEAEALGMNERYAEDDPYQPVERTDGFTSKTLGRLRFGTRDATDPLPPVHYPWQDTAAALNALKESEIEGDPFDGLHLMLQSPLDGGPTLPTIAWHVQMLREREKTRAHRHNSTTCYQVFEGSGATLIEGERIEWGPGDLFTVPAWRRHSHENAGSQDAILFSIDDWPAMTKLGFYRKQEAPA